jgi:hypothetical protein
MASRWSKINLFAHCNGFNLPETFSFEIFGKSFSNKILKEQRKFQQLLEKPCRFSEKYLKNQEYALDF